MANKNPASPSGLLKIIVDRVGGEARTYNRPFLQCQFVRGSYYKSI